MHGTLGIWVGCAVGQAVYIALRVQNMLRSHKNECDTIGEIAHVYGLETLTKVLIVFAIQGVWINSATSFSSILTSVGLPTPPLIVWTAFGWGLLGAVVFDSLAEKYPYLRRVLKGNGNEAGTP